MRTSESARPTGAAEPGTLGASKAPSSSIPLDAIPLALWISTGLYLVLVLRNAWLADDAYITLRTVDHFVHGRGLVWNLGSRVQAYTHPLWMMVLSVVYFVTREDYFTLILVGAGVSAAAWVWGARQLQPDLSASERSPLPLLALLPLLASPSFVDYSTSGLENPLSHLLVAALAGRAFIGIGDPRALERYGLLCALLMLNRLDYALLCLPAGAWAAVGLWREGVELRRLVWAVFVASAPLLAWEMFSLLYYGMLVPNTALAKLGAGIGTGERVFQGVMYLLSTMWRDPALMALLGVGLAVGLARARTRPLAVGVALYALYVVWIGGDFMMGRFFTAPAFAAALMLGSALAESPSGARGAHAVAVASLSLLGFAAPRAPWTPPEIDQRAKGLKDMRGVADEQAFWYRASGLLARSQGRPGITSHYRDEGEALAPDAVVTVGSCGFLGFFAPPSARVVDYFALADPLLARIPARRVVPWRPGHYGRHIPKGYVKTLETGKNRLADPVLAALHDDLRLVTEGPLLSAARFGAIWRINTGAHRAAGELETLRFPDAVRVRLDAWPRPPEDPALRFRGSGLWVSLGAVRHHGQIELPLSPNASFEVVFRREGEELGRATVRVAPEPPTPRASVTAPAAAVAAGYDELVILPTRGRRWHMRAPRFGPSRAAK